MHEKSHVSASAHVEKVGGLVTSHSFDKNKFDQLSDANIGRHFRAFEHEGYTKLIIIPTGMLNEPTRDPELSETGKRVASFEFTYDFLYSKVELILGLKIPFEIMSFEQLKFDGLDEPVHDLFVKEGDDRVERTREHLKNWRARVIQKFTAVEEEKRPTINEGFKEMLDHVQGYAQVNKRYKKAMEQLAHIFHEKNGSSIEANLQYLFSECAFNICLSDINERVFNDDVKKIHALAYTGGDFPSVLLITEKAMIPHVNQIILIKLTDDNTFEVIDTASPNSRAVRGLPSEVKAISSGRNSAKKITAALNTEPPSVKKAPNVPVVVKASGSVNVCDEEFYGFSAFIVETFAEIINKSSSPLAMTCKATIPKNPVLADRVRATVFSQVIDLTKQSGVEAEKQSDNGYMFSPKKL